MSDQPSKATSPIVCYGLAVYLIGSLLWRVLIPAHEYPGSTATYLGIAVAWRHPPAPRPTARAARHETSLCLGRIDTPAGLKAIGHMEWAGSAARIER